MSIFQFNSLCVCRTAPNLTSAIEIDGEEGPEGTHPHPETPFHFDLYVNPFMEYQHH